MKLNTKLASILFEIFFLLTILTFISGSSDNYYSECGESPTHKYKELAKAIGKFYKFVFNKIVSLIINYFLQKGWDWYQLITFIKAEKPAEYEKILKAVKQYADCIALINIPI